MFFPNEGDMFKKINSNSKKKKPSSAVHCDFWRNLKSWYLPLSSACPLKDWCLLSHRLSKVSSSPSVGNFPAATSLWAQIQPLLIPLLPPAMGFNHHTTSGTQNFPSLWMLLT